MTTGNMWNIVIDVYSTIVVHSTLQTTEHIVEWSHSRVNWEEYAGCIQVNSRMPKASQTSYVLRCYLTETRGVLYMLGGGCSRHRWQSEKKEVVSWEKGHYRTVDGDSGGGLKGGSWWEMGKEREGWARPWRALMTKRRHFCWIWDSTGS